MAKRKNQLKAKDQEIKDEKQRFLEIRKHFPNVRANDEFRHPPYHINGMAIGWIMDALWEMKVRSEVSAS